MRDWEETNVELFCFNNVTLRVTSVKVGQIHCKQYFTLKLKKHVCYSAKLRTSKCCIKFALFCENQIYTENSQTRF